VRARTRKVAVLSAATQDQVAATLGQLADSYPQQTAGLRELSQVATSYATWLRQWANDRPSTG